MRVTRFVVSQLCRHKLIELLCRLAEAKNVHAEYTKYLCGLTLYEREMERLENGEASTFYETYVNDPIKWAERPIQGDI